MTDDRLQQIEQAIAEAEAQGLAWTNRTIYERTGGSYEQLAAYLRDRRAQAHAEALVAVAVEAPPAPAPSTTPLHRARRERDRTAEAEHALGVEEQTLRQQRQTLEQGPTEL